MFDESYAVFQLMTAYLRELEPLEMYDVAFEHEAS
jgi:hypothetical protein